MKLSRSAVRRKTHVIPTLRFEQQRLTSFAGLLLFQVLFSRLDLRRRLRGCFGTGEAIYDRAVILLSLIVHLLLGFRQLRDARYYRDDPMVCRVLGLARFPDVSTVSRFLSEAGADNVERMRRLCRELVVERLVALAPRRLTLDFDGSVIGTGRWAEGTAVGFNRRKKGQRSYYPLFCTVAQTGQVFDLLHRPGNVHDSRGAKDFLVASIEHIRHALPGISLEVRLDAAFFSDHIVRTLDELGVEFSISVPFDRFVELKRQVESRRRWHRINPDLAYFEDRWKPKSWPRRYRFLFLRTRHRRRSAEPVQLDLFLPVDLDFRYTAIVTNKAISARSVARFHHGRGAQEGVFAELKSQGQLDYVPSRTLAGNQLFMLAAIFAHNLNRELQMTVRAAQRTTTPTRAPLWSFHQLAASGNNLLRRAGRFTRPQGALTLTISANPSVERELLHCLDRLENAA